MRTKGVPVPVEEFLLIKMLREVSCVLFKLCHMQARGRGRGNTSTHLQSHTHNRPDVVRGIGDAAQCKVVSRCQDLDAMRKRALTTHILLEGCLQRRDSM